MELATSLTIRQIAPSKKDRFRRTSTSRTSLKTLMNSRWKTRRDLAKQCRWDKVSTWWSHHLTKASLARNPIMLELVACFRQGHGVSPIKISRCFPLGSRTSRSPWCSAVLRRSPKSHSMSQLLAYVAPINSQSHSRQREKISVNRIRTW